MTGQERDSEKKRRRQISRLGIGLNALCQKPLTDWPFWAVLAIALLVAIVCLTVPMAAPDLGDSAWCGVLNWAHTHHLQFGKEIIFTYGPLGYVIAPYCLEGPAETLILANAALCFYVAVGLSMVARRLGSLWRYVLLSIFLIEAANAEFRADLLLETGLFCWGLVSLTESDWRQEWCAGGFVVFAALTGMIKVTYLFAGGISVLAISVLLLFSGRTKLGILLPPGYVAAVLVAWFATGQTLSFFSSFIMNGFRVSQEYDQAAGLSGLPMLRSWGVCLTLAALGTILIRVFSTLESTAKCRLWRNLVLFGWVSALLLVTSKHSLVRLDRQHFFDLAVFVPVATLGLEALPSESSRIRTTAQIASIACCLLSLVIVELAFLPGLAPSLSQVVSQTIWHSKWLVSPAECKAAFTPTIERRLAEAQLPTLREMVGNSTIDVFGTHQGHALLNGLNYHPRPVFQSYLAYAKPLARLNEDFYLSSNAPDFVLFELAGLEHRFPSLDDSLALRSLMFGYSFVAAEKSFLLLKRKSPAPVQMSLLREGVIQFGQRLEVLSESDCAVWVEMEIRPSWYGRILKLAYRLKSLRLSVWESPSAAAKPLFRRQTAVASLETGFFGAPFLATSQDAQAFITGEMTTGGRAYSIEADAGSEALWNPSIGFRIYKIPPSGVNR